MASQPNADGGLYAWIIVAGSHVVQAIYMGDIAGSSLFFVIFTEYFQEGGGRTFAIVSLQTCVPILIAPLVGVLTKRFGCRPLVIAGGLLSMVANLVTSFATSLKWMYFSYGIIQGWLYDVTSNYNISFIMGGVTTILAGCVVLVQLRYLRYKSKRLPSDCQYDPIAYSDGATEEHKAGVEKLAWMETTL